jgi:tripartite-type tricarboxylate transporter receptor subunit TctC
MLNPSPTTAQEVHMLDIDGRDFMRRMPNITRRDATRGIGLGLLAASLPFGSARAAYPDMPIKMIVPVPPGSGVDAVSRALGQQMGEQMGVPFVNEYKPGASAVVGTEALAKAAPDGYTVMTAYTAHATNPLFNANIPYDTLKDFTPIVNVCYTPTVLMVHPSLPVNSVQDLVKLIKEKPGNYTYASGGVGAGAHLSGEWFKQRAGLDIQHVPYKGNAPAVNDMLGGHNTLMFDIPTTTVPLVQAGKLKALAVADKKRLPELPDVPTMIEQGFPDFEVSAWYMLLGPAKMPADILGKLNTEANKALQTPGVREKLATLGFVIVGGSPEEADAFVRAEMKKWSAVVEKAGLKPQ